MNVVLLVIDTLRADHLSAYGYARGTSPNLERLQQNGVRFEEAFVQCNFSGGSYASIFTGLYPHNHGVRDHPMALPGRNETMAEVFRRAGYRTYGRHGHGYLKALFNYDQGFEDYAYHRSAEETTADAIGFLETVGTKRFFMFLQYKNPHYMYEPPPGFRDRWMTAPSGFARRLARGGRNKTRLMFGFEQLGITRDDFDYLVSLYDGEILYADSMLGRIDDTLRRTGLRDETIVVVTADHGESLREHGTTFNHDANLYDEVIHVPLVFANPRLFPHPLAIPGPVQSIDILPTLTDLIGITPPRNVDGRSLLPVVDSPDASRLAFAEGRPLEPTRARLRTALNDPIPHYRMYLPGLTGKWRSVRSATHMLIYIPKKPEPEWELYDVVRDPGETTNIAGRPDALGTARTLMQALDAWMANDPGGANEVKRTPEILEQLRALGYAEGESHERQERAR